jgi:hypothetical protein
MSTQPPLGPTQGQAHLLYFFGRTAKTKAEAHQIISELMSVPANKHRWICERARLCVATMQPAVSGSHGHDATFAVACALVHGFALSHADAMPIMQEYNQRCSPPWSERELDYKLRSADKSGHDKPRGHLIGDDFKPNPSTGSGPRGPQTAPAKEWASPPSAAGARPSKVTFDPVKLRALSEKWRDVVNLPWLANRSVVDPSQLSAADFLQLLFGAGHRIICFTNQKTQGQALWPVEPPPAGGPDGVWFLPQPVSGEMLPNPRTGNKSRRSEESVTDFRYMVLESDEADVRDWLGFLVQIPLRIDAIYTSGGRSVHALVRVDCRTKREWDAYKEQLAPTINLLCLGGLDPAVITAVRLTRLPGCWRGDRLQKLLYVRPGAPVRPLTEMPPVRDVVKQWTDLAAAGVSDAEESNERACQVLNALDYYAPASKPCREALVTFKASCDAAGFDVGTKSP